FLADLVAVPTDSLARRLWDDQRQRWAAGEKTMVEAYLAILPSPTHGGIILDLIYGEFVLRQEAAEKPTIQEYQKRFPHYATEIGRQLSFHKALSQCEIEAPPTADHETIIQKDAPNADRWATVSPSRSAVAHTPPPAEVSNSPSVIAGYKIVASLGEGGQGLVYRAV